jgi:hypothetical protein
MEEITTQEGYNNVRVYRQEIAVEYEKLCKEVPVRYFEVTQLRHKIIECDARLDLAKHFNEDFEREYLTEYHSRNTHFKIQGTT